MRRVSLRAAALLILAGACPALSGNPPPAKPPMTDPDAIRQEFKAAMQRVHQRLPEPADSPALETYVLHDYLMAARLRRDVASSSGDDSDTAVDTFLRAHAGQPVAHALQREWLMSLAGRQRWDWFLPRTTDAADATLICDRLTGRLATGDTSGLAQDALARWSLPQKQPDECNAVFSWLRTQGALTPELAEHRTRAALAADNARLAREFVTDVPVPRRAALIQWIQLLESPATTLAVLAASPAMPVEADALAAGVGRLSISDAAAAADLLPGLLKRPDMTPALQSRMQRAAALGAAYSRLPSAVAAFSALSPDTNDGQVQEWRVRAALWSGDFSKTLEWIDAMPSSLASQPRWRYWRARAVASTSGPAAAVPLYAAIAGMRDYYGYLAADKLNQSYSLNSHASPDDAAAQAALAAEPGLIRAHALFDCDMSDDAAAEWASVVAGAKPAVKIQAAHLASRWAWYSQTIATLAQAGEWDDVPLRYPRPYAGMVAEAAKEARIPDDWLFAVMRQESLFRKDAVSRADARGLMQMQPPTATAVARRWHLAAPTRDGLFDPELALRLGALYVRELLDKYQGQLDETLAAYNAGPMSVARWLPNNPVDADIWIENIPYTETRGYIQHIFEHIVAFAAMREAPQERLSSLMPRVEPAPKGP